MAGVVGMAQMLDGERNGVEQGGGAVRLGEQKSILHLGAIAGVIGQQLGPALHGDQKQLVAWRQVFAEASQHVERAAPFGVHAAAGVQDDGQRQRRILVGEEADGLLAAVVEDAELFLRQAGDRPVVRIED